MSSDKNSGRKEHYALSDQLRIGLYIYIDLPWFRHPFTLNSFKIRTAEQLRDLRALKETRFRYDPERSDGPLTAPPAPVPETPPVEAEPVEAPPDPVMLEKAARIQQLEEHRQAVEQMEKAFVKAANVMRNLNKNLLARPKETLEEMGGLIDQMVTVFLESPELTLQVMGEKGGGEEAYYHGLNVSILCMMLAKGLDFTNEQAKAMGTGAILHDIGLIEIPDRVLKKSPEEYTKPERDLRAMHVEYGVKIGQKLGLPPEVLLILAQHHELADGTGYPQGLTLDKITPLARVVSLVNFYDNLCNPVDFAQAMTPHEALSFMFAQRRAKFDSKALQLMIRSLGVYPPGSIVKLSNEAIALVVSVNPQKPLRPWVLLYDEAVPKEEAIMLNLETAPELSIGKAIRPALLPPRVYAYLSPRKRVTYFFDGESPNSGAES
jgi:putative nucleotidyltransferase with HDIG domain